MIRRAAFVCGFRGRKKWFMKWEAGSVGKGGGGWGGAMAIMY